MKRLQHVGVTLLLEGTTLDIGGLV